MSIISFSIILLSIDAEVYASALCLAFTIRCRHALYGGERLVVTCKQLWGFVVVC